MDATKIKELEDIIKAALLIEQYQTAGLITPAIRTKHLDLLKSRAELAIEAITGKEI